MAFVVRALPSPPAPETPARWTRWSLALAVTCAVGLASFGVSIASTAGMAAVFLSCGDGGEWSVSRATQGENCPVFFHAAYTAFRVSLISMVVSRRVLDLLRTCLARSKAKERKAAARVKFLDYAIIFEHIVPASCIFLIFVGLLLESRSVKGSVMETAASVIFYLGLGVMSLISAVLAIVAVVLVAVALCVVVAICAMALWECYNTVETKS